MSPPPATRPSAASSWAAALSGWAIPEEILRRAPESPWHFPPGLFLPPAPSLTPAAPSVSARAALAALDDGGAVLDIGCGGGAAGVALVPPAARLTGVDASGAMLANFRAAAARLGIPCRAVQGRWPDVAGEVDQADVAVCHHVVYNVADLAPFLLAMAAHARRRVVVELTDRHPSSSLSPLWERFWGLSRPEQPSAELFIEVALEIGFVPVASRWERPVEKAAAGPDDYVAFVRRRLCLTADRDAEVAEALASNPAPLVQLVTVSWDTA